MKRAAFLCLLLTACDQAAKKGSGRETESPGSRSSTRASSAQEDAATKRSGQIASAHADPEIQRLLPGAMEVIAAGGDVLDPDGPLEASELLNYYVARYPEAGLDWVLSLDAEKGKRSREAFGDLLYTRDPAMCYGLFSRIPPGKSKIDYLRGLTIVAYQAGNIDGLWEGVGANSAACDSSVLGVLVRGGGSKVDPMDFWTRVSARPGNEVTPAQFLEMVSPTAWKYPGALLDQVPADQRMELLQRAIDRSESARNLSAVTGYLETRPPVPEEDESNARLALKMAENQKNEEALRAAKRITDAALRQRTLDRIAEP